MIKINKYKLPLIYILYISILNIIGLKNIIMSALIIIFLIALDIKEKNLTKTLIYSVFSPSYIVIQIMIIYSLLKFIIRKMTIEKDHNYKIMISFLFIIIVSYSVSLIKDFTFIPIIIYCGTTLFAYSVYFIFRSEKKSELESFYYLAKFQIIPVVYQIITSILKGTYFPDIIVGTIGDCNMLVIFLMIYLILLVQDKSINKRKKIIHIIIYGIVIVMAEAKIVLAILCSSILLTAILIKRYRNKFLKLAILFLGSASIIISTMLLIQPLVNIFTGYQIVEYINNDSKNMKFKAYDYTFTQLDFVEDIIGVGVGRYGSKAANSLAYDTMYKNENAIKLPKVIKPRTNEKYKYVASMSTKEFYEQIKWTSGILSYPQSSVITIKGELGYSGLFVVLGFAVINIIHLKRNTLMKINKKESYCSIILILFLILANFFDNYLEMNNLILVFSFILSNAYLDNKLEKV